jgi:hypothetical protein
VDKISLKIGTKLIVYKTKFYPSQITGKMRLVILPHKLVLSGDT